MNVLINPEFLFNKNKNIETSIPLNIKLLKMEEIE